MSRYRKQGGEALVDPAALSDQSAAAAAAVIAVVAAVSAAAEKDDKYNDDPETRISTTVTTHSITPFRRLRSGNIKSFWFVAPPRAVR